MLIFAMIAFLIRNLLMRTALHVNDFLDIKYREDID